MREAREVGGGWWGVGFLQGMQGRAHGLLGCTASPPTMECTPLQSSPGGTPDPRTRDSLVGSAGEHANSSLRREVRSAQRQAQGARELAQGRDTLG